MTIDNKKPGRLYRLLIIVQGSYSLLTALWGLVHIESFMRVTGPKTDVWLVKTVSVLLVAITLTLFSFLWERKVLLPALLLGFLTALGMLGIDIYYSLQGRIRWVYLLDALPEGIFCLSWIIIYINSGKEAFPRNRG